MMSYVNGKSTKHKKIKTKHNRKSVSATKSFQYHIVFLSLFYFSAHPKANLLKLLDTYSFQFFLLFIQTCLTLDLADQNLHAVILNNKNVKGKVFITQSCSTLCDPLDCSSPGSSVHGILQTRRLEWVTMPSSRGSSRPRD